MTKKTILTIAGLVAAVALLLTPQNAEAAKYLTPPTGTLVQKEGTPHVFFIGSNGKAYVFPNEATYKTWYSSFSQVKVMKYKTFKRIEKAGIKVTVRPGSHLVKFENSNKIYYVSPGAILHWVKNPFVARQLDGENWEQNLVVLPDRDIGYYALGKDVNEITDIEVERIAKNPVELAKEMKRKNAFEKNKNIEVDPEIKTAINLPTLESITENLSGKLSPKFDSDTTSYVLKAKADENFVSFIPEASHSDSEITVDGMVVPTGSNITIKLLKNVEEVVFKVKAPSGRTMEYTVKIKKAEGSDEARLKSLKENLADSLYPKFDPDKSYYHITANKSEQIVRIKPVAKDKNATVRVNDKVIKAGEEYVKMVSSGLRYTFVIEVESASGKTEEYRLVVDKK